MPKLKSPKVSTTRIKRPSLYHEMQTPQKESHQPPTPRNRRDRPAHAGNIPRDCRWPPRGIECKPKYKRKGKKENNATPKQVAPLHPRKCAQNLKSDFSTPHNPKPGKKKHRTCGNSSRCVPSPSFSPSHEKERSVLCWHHARHDSLDARCRQELLCSVRPETAIIET